MFGYIVMSAYIWQSCSRFLHEQRPEIKRKEGNEYNSINSQLDATIAIY